MLFCLFVLKSVGLKGSAPAHSACLSQLMHQILKICIIWFISVLDCGTGSLLRHKGHFIEACGLFTPVSNSLVQCAGLVGLACIGS